MLLLSRITKANVIDHIIDMGNKLDEADHCLKQDAG